MDSEFLARRLNELSEQNAVLIETVADLRQLVASHETGEIKLIDANRLYDEIGRSNLLDSSLTAKMTLCIDTPDPRKSHYLSIELTERRARDVGTPEDEHVQHQVNRLTANLSKAFDKISQTFKEQLEKI